MGCSISLMERTLICTMQTRQQKSLRGANSSSRCLFPAPRLRLDFDVIAATDPGHRLNGTLIEVPEKQPIDGDAKMASDETCRFERERSFAGFIKIVGALIDS